MLESQPADGVGQFDVDPDVVAVEFEGVVAEQATVDVDLHPQPSQRRLHHQLPMTVVIGVALKVDRPDPGAGIGPIDSFG